MMRTNTRPIDLNLIDIEKFWSFVLIQGPEDCWIWQGSDIKDGYGLFRIGRRKDDIQILAHRISYTIAYHDPDGNCVLHTCDFPPCVNPRHLFLGDDKINSLDMTSKGRHHNSKGDKNGNSKLTEKEVREILKTASDISIDSLAEKYNVNRETIWSILKRKTWRHINA